MDEYPTDAQIDAAIAVLREEMPLAYGPARSCDYVSDGSTGAKLEAELAALRAADEEAEQQNRDLVRRALIAARDRPCPPS